MRGIQSRHKAIFLSALIVGLTAVGFQNCAKSGSSGDSSAASLLVGHKLQGSCDASAPQGICVEDYQSNAADVNADMASCGPQWATTECPKSAPFHACTMVGDGDPTDGEAVGPFKTYYYANSTLNLQQAKTDCTDGQGQWE